MALDEQAIRRIMREERQAERERDEAAAREKARDDEISELRETVKGLTTKKAPNEEKPDDHEFAE